MRFTEFKQTPATSSLFEAKDDSLIASTAIHTVNMLDAITDKVPEEDVGRLVQFNAMLAKIVSKTTSTMRKLGIPIPDEYSQELPAPASDEEPVEPAVNAEPEQPVPAVQQPSEVDRVKQLAGVAQAAQEPTAEPVEPEVTQPEEEEEPIAEGSMYKRSELKYEFPEELARAKGELAKIKDRIKVVADWPSKSPEMEQFKNHQIKEWQDALVAAMRVYKGFKAAVSDRELFKRQKEEADKFLQDIAKFLTVLGDRVQGYSQGLEGIDLAGLKSAEKKKIINAQQFTSTLRQALFGMIIEIANKRETSVTPEQIKGFLQACVDGKVIDMNAVVSNDSGNIKDALNGDWADVFDLFTRPENNIFEYSPGTTSGAVGPGEMALSMMANPTEKAPVGDLMVNGTMYEVKAGKKNGGRLNSKGIGKATTGWKVWSEKIEEIVKNNAPPTATFQNTDSKGNPVTVKTKQFSANMTNANTNKTTKRTTFKVASKYNWNAKGFTALNAEILPHSTRAQTVDLFVSSFKSIFNNWNAVVKKMDELGVGSPSGLIGQAISRDGKKVDLDRMNEAITALAFVSYHLEDHIENILFLNTLTLDYSIIRGEGGDPTDLLEKLRNGAVKVTSGFNWNDAQQTPTPSYNAGNLS